MRFIDLKISQRDKEYLEMLEYTKELTNKYLYGVFRIKSDRFGCHDIMTLQSNPDAKMP